MSDEVGTRIIHRGTPESAAMLADVKRAMAITATLNRLTFDDADEIRALFSQLIGKEVDESFLLIPPFYTAGGKEIRVGHNVFVNQNCTFYDLGGLDIADDVMIGPNVSIITAGHPLEPSRRRAETIGKPIVIARNVWIAAGATIIGGVTVGENSIVAAASVVTGTSPRIPSSEEIRRGSFVRLATADGKHSTARYCSSGGGVPHWPRISPYELATTTSRNAPISIAIPSRRLFLIATRVSPAFTTARTAAIGTR
jgi:acetyltransferase-like isoleucine patch superfamily enzyme